jgi:hypothetical protein
LGYGLQHNGLLSKRLGQARSPKDGPQEDKEMKDLVFKRIQLDRVDSSRQNEWLVDFLVRSFIGLLVTLLALFTLSANGRDPATNKTGEGVNPARLVSPGPAISPVSEAEQFNRAWYKAHLEMAGGGMIYSPGRLILVSRDGTWKTGICYHFSGFERTDEVLRYNHLAETEYVDEKGDVLMLSWAVECHLNRRE